LATYFREQLRKEVSDLLKKANKEDGTSYNIFTDGLKIETTIHSKIQTHAEAAVRQHMASLQKEFFNQMKGNKQWQKDKNIIDFAMKRSDRYKAMKEAGKSEKEILEAFNKPIKMKLFSYNGEISKTISPLDSIRYSLSFLHTGFLVMEPNTAEIKAWVGGIDHHYFKYDHVNLNTKRQVGSTFKPIVYAAALEKGMSPCEYLKNEQVVYKEYENWSPRNADNKYGGEYSIKGALTNSVNTISAQLIMKTGIPQVAELAHQMGIESPICMVPSLALGTTDASLIEMVGAYSVFANGGVYAPPTFIKKITDAQGNVIYDGMKEKRKTKRVFSRSTSDRMVHMLQNVVDHGTGARLRYKYGLTGDIAGKTGTTQNHADGWFIGFTPTLVAGAWVGAEDRRIHFRSIDMGQGASTALPIWGLFMKNVASDPALKKYAASKFNLQEDFTSIACADFIPPDTTQKHWWWPFGGGNHDEEQQYDPMSFSQPAAPVKESKDKEKPLDIIKGLFKKKKR
jgi:penicillin-binding protein 1A